MAWYKAAAGFVSKLFTGEKGIIEQTSDVVDKWMPSKTTIHKMSIEDQQAGDQSQDSARKMQQASHGSWVDIIIDAWSRTPRPAFATWAFGLLVGWWEPPRHLLMATEGGSIVWNPILGNIIWTIITFYFGARVIFKDIPAAIAIASRVISKIKDIK